MVQCFAPFMVDTVAAKIWLVQIYNIELFGWLFQKNVFIYATVVWYFIALAYFCIRPAEKLYLGGKLAKAIKAAKNS